MAYLAQKFQFGGQQITGPLKIPGTDNPTLGDIINQVNSFLLPFASIILFFVLVWGGYDFLLSQGDPGKVKSAQAKITTAIIGFVLLLTAYLITQVFARIFKLGGGLF